ncbi:hypothetical protein DFJ73DRAFT_864456 [Zopfochytrium polystomum]|nr:hypothetical protein DFJ73DRAFT_864456 [Zopfochytrium polystomum]
MNEIYLVLGGLVVLTVFACCLGRRAASLKEARVRADAALPATTAAQPQELPTASRPPATDSDRAPAAHSDPDALPLYTQSPVGGASLNLAHHESEASAIELTQIVTASGADVTAAGEGRFPPAPSLAPPMYSPS